MHAIVWPEGYVPGFSDNFASNEVIVAGLAAARVWPLLARPEAWPTYYENCSDIAFHGAAGPELAAGTRFFFRTFGFPVECEVTEYEVPEGNRPGRVAWHGWSGEGDQRLDVHHAWLVEDLSGGRVRVLTQETQNGAPAKELAAAVPNPMINGHQAWLVGLIAAAQG
ncbi:SRPBCC domain-containing protein [Novosphingobium flavum]|uniref:SRPBCC domain-containing protein n=1 Tax=Novosphingobium flavum TaxID=1778672 RepID=A0A7X1FU84_9SPHN|nr:SRPBCC domain-containing protein [Novosphingobium flavum]MBC2666924.1 SRPBCC domain-containing protein [Novosphingobium flavum]